VQPSLPLFTAGAAGAAEPSSGPVGREQVDGLDGFLVGDVVKVAGLRGTFRCKAFFLAGEVPSAEVFGPLLDGRKAAKVPAVRTFPLARLQPGRRRRRPPSG
jgi:hypothetical protein